MPFTKFEKGTNFLGFELKDKAHVYYMTDYLKSYNMNVGTFISIYYPSQYHGDFYCGMWLDVQIDDGHLDDEITPEYLERMNYYKILTLRPQYHL